MRKIILLSMHLFSLLFLGFGLTLNILKIDITANLFISINLFNEKRSILGTLQNLLQGGNWLSFLLILLFGIVIPLVKSGIIFYILSGKKSSVELHRLVSVISKWAMADVFAVSIFIAFLGARAMKNTTASLEPGFYFFTAYVLLSAIIVNFLAPNAKIPPSYNA